MSWSEARKIISAIFPDAFNKDRAGKGAFRNAPELSGTALGDFLTDIRKSSDFAMAYNRLFLGAKVEKEDEFFLLVEENQNVAYWAVRASDLGQADPPIYRSNNVPPIVWAREWSNASSFYSALAMWQGVKGGFDVTGVAFNIGNEQRRAIAESLEKVNLDENSSGCEFLWSPDASVLVAIAGNEIHAAARTIDAWRLLDSLDVPWDYCSLDDL